jgi:hypothetical protein
MEDPPKFSQIGIFGLIWQPWSEWADQIYVD